MTTRKLFILLALAGVMQTAHYAEHVAQLIQIYVYYIAPAEAHGLLGYLFDFEWVHVIYNLGLEIFLLWLWVGYRTVARTEPATLSRVGLQLLIGLLVFQGYHSIEHLAKLYQYLFIPLYQSGMPPTPGILPLLTGWRIFLVHFWLNTIVWGALVLILWYLRPNFATQPQLQKRLTPTLSLSIIPMPFTLSYWLSGVMILLVMAAATFDPLRPFQVLPRIGLAPGFVVTTQDEASLTSDDLRGQVTLYNFTYTRCQSPCVDTTATMQAVSERLKTISDLGLNVRLVTISLDPEHDTPAVLRDFGVQQQADFRQWQFVRADLAATKRVVGGGFGVSYATQATGAPEFDPTLMLVDGWGILRAEYRTNLPKIDIILRDIRLIADEARNSTGLTRWAYEAAHLFACYPR